MTDRDLDDRPDESEDNHHDHGHHAHDIEELRAAVITVSSTRSIEEDAAGDAIVDAFTEAGHTVSLRERVRDEYDGVQDALDRIVDRRDVDTIVTTGGTGVTPDDVTIEAARPLFNKELPGFGELFRAWSVEEIGTRAIATRATAGLADGVPVFCLPGSEDAAALGSEIVVVEAPHLAGLARRDEDGSDET